MSGPTVKINIGRKLLAITLLNFVGMIVILVLLYQGLASSLMQEKTLQSRTLSDAGMSIIKHFYGRISVDGLTNDEARTQALRVLESTTFGKNGYFWVNDIDGVLLMNPYSPEMVGTSSIGSVDVRGNHLFREFVKTARAGGGLVEYYWPKPGSDEHSLKASYVVHFEPWGWVLGAGLYSDDVDLEIRNYASSALGVVFAFTVVMIVFSMSLTKTVVYQLESMAIRDPLSTLYTRRYLNESKDRLIARHKRSRGGYLAVVFLDVDFFKRINDSYGHPCGDKVIAKIGEIIKATSRPNDICVRYGGEEFVVVLLSAKRNAAIRLAERIRDRAGETRFSHNGSDFCVTLSAGVAVYEEGESLDETMQRADDKLYQAKARGRDCIVS